MQISRVLGSGGVCPFDFLIWDAYRRRRKNGARSEFAETNCFSISKIRGDSCCVLLDFVIRELEAARRSQETGASFDRANPNSAAPSPSGRLDFKICSQTNGTRRSSGSRQTGRQDAAADLPSVALRRDVAVPDCIGLQHRQPLTTAGAAEENQQLVALQLAPTSIQNPLRRSARHVR